MQAVPIETSERQQTRIKEETLMRTLEGKNIAIVGAGVSGLAAAYRLQQKGAKVTVFDKRDYIGGRTRSVHIGEFIFDVGALVMLPTYKNVYGLIKELGIEGHIHETKPSLAIVRDGKRHSFDYAHPYRSALSSKLISWPSKLKMLKLLPLLYKYWPLLNYENLGQLHELDKESTHDWCLRELNQEIDDYLASPFIRINSLTDTRSAPIGEWIWQLAIYQSPHIFQLDQGMAFYAESLARDLDVRLNTKVDKVVNANGKAVVTIGNSATTYDACVLAVPPPFAHEIAPSVTPQQEKYFSSVEPVSVITLHLGLGKKPDIADAIIMFPEKENPHLLDILLDHNKGPGRAPPGKAAIAIQTTMQWSAAHADASDAQIIAELLTLAKPYIGDVSRDIEVSYVNRWDFVCAKTYPGYYTMLGEYVKTRNLNQPLFFCGDFFSGGIEGATLAGLNAHLDVERYLGQAQLQDKTVVAATQISAQAA
jgi:oxygen-dependent protoporphyrinogen oxidase